MIKIGSKVIARKMVTTQMIAVKEGLFDGGDGNHELEDWVKKLLT